MYRRVNSGRWIGFTTALIVVVMAVFTWVMYGMAQQVFTMTDIMQELNTSIKSMVGTQVSMADAMGQMAGNMENMSGQMDEMQGSIASMSGSVGMMSDAMGSLAVNMNRMTYDFNQAIYAISNPLSYMWGNSMPF